ncbi:hypothetical protein EGT07_11410 [Herbaspirillum sp. HC18]|nr:hypothetical protein EGT07_11410 [Herbaspirillum sp. HC18]
MYIGVNTKNLVLTCMYGNRNMQILYCQQASPKCSVVIDEKSTCSLNMALPRERFAKLALVPMIATILAACGSGSGSTENPSDQADLRSPQPALAISNMPPGLTLVAGYIGGAGTLDGTGTSARFSASGGIAIDPADNLLVADRRSGLNSFVLRKVTPGGIVTTPSVPASPINTFDRTGIRYMVVGDSIAKVALDGTVSTLAGVADSSGFIDGSGADARLVGIGKLVTDQAGNVYAINTKWICQTTKPYLCTSEGGAVRKITPGGVVTTLAGNIGADNAGLSDGIGASARFTNLYGLTIDETGTLFVSDSGLIRKISPSGEVTTLPKDPASSTATALAAGDLAVGKGNVLFALGFDGLYKVATSGVMTLFADLGDMNFGPAQPFTTDASVRSLVADSVGNLFVTRGNALVNKVTPTGSVSNFAGMAALSGSVDGKGTLALFQRAESIARDIDGNLYLTEEGGNVRKIAPDGTTTTLGSSFSAPKFVDETGAEAPIIQPRGIAVAPDGNIYIGDFLTIRKLTKKTGVLTIFAGSKGIFGDKDGVGTNATFSSIRSMVADNSGNLYVAESHSIRKVTPSGVVTTLAGSSTGGTSDGKGVAAHFNLPAGITLDNAGNLYIADTENATIRKLSPDGVVTTVAGSPSMRGLVDGIGSAARFNSPKDMTADAAGNVYVIDTGTVRKITPAGVVATIAGNSQFTGTRLGELPGNFARLAGITYLGANVLAVSDGTSVLKLAVP